MTQEPLDWEAMLVEKAMASEAFKRELLGNPKAVIARESGQKWPDGVEIEVLEQTPEKLYLVLPLKGKGEESYSEELSDEELDAVAGGGPKASGMYNHKEHGGTHNPKKCNDWPDWRK